MLAGSDHCDHNIAGSTVLGVSIQLWATYGTQPKQLTGAPQLHVPSTGSRTCGALQVERQAAGEAAPGDEDVRGPHNALAVRLAQRDAGHRPALVSKGRFHEQTVPLRFNAAALATAGNCSQMHAAFMIKLSQAHLSLPLLEITLASDAVQQAVLGSLLAGHHCACMEPCNKSKQLPDNKT